MFQEYGAGFRNRRRGTVEYFGKKGVDGDHKDVVTVAQGSGQIRGRESLEILKLNDSRISNPEIRNLRLDCPLSDGCCPLCNVPGAMTGCPDDRMTKWS